LSLLKQRLNAIKTAFKHCFNGELTATTFPYNPTSFPKGSMLFQKR